MRLIPQLSHSSLLWNSIKYIKEERGETKCNWRFCLIITKAFSPCSFRKTHSGRIPAIPIKIFERQKVSNKYCFYKETHKHAVLDEFFNQIYLIIFLVYVYNFISFFIYHSYWREKKKKKEIILNFLTSLKYNSLLKLNFRNNDFSFSLTTTFQHYLFSLKIFFIWHFDSAY